MLEFSMHQMFYRKSKKGSDSKWY